MRVKEMHPLCCITLENFSGGIGDQSPEEVTSLSRSRSLPVSLPAFSNNNNTLQISGSITRVAGVLYKWTNYGKGWRSRWFVLRDGVLSYSKSSFQSPDDDVRLIGQISTNRLSRRKRQKTGGIVHLKVSRFRESKSDDRRFYIFTATKTLHLRTESKKDRVTWIQALASSRSLFSLQIVNDNIPFVPNDLSLSTQKLKKRLLEEGISDAVVKDCEQIILSEFSEMQGQLKVLLEERSCLIDTLRELEAANIEIEANGVHNGEYQLMKHDFSTECSGKYSECTTTESSDDVEKQDLEDGSDADESFFYDTKETFSELTLSCGSAVGASDSLDKVKDLESRQDDAEKMHHKQRIENSVHVNVQRRKKLPDPVEKEKRVSLWSMIKDNVGKDLTRVCLPVYFNEPISSLQKCCEDMEYSHLLDQAYEYGRQGNNFLRVLKVAAFAVSGRPGVPIHTFRMNRLFNHFVHICKRIFPPQPHHLCHLPLFKEHTNKTSFTNPSMAKMCHHFPSIFFLTLLHLLHFSSPKLEVSTPPPLPILPLPSFSQLKWQQREVIMFLHFGPNTFTDSEWGTGAESPAVFNPTALDATQWAATAAAAGISLMILTAKHHDGFCLWPSKYTTHSVSRSPWKDGQGDVVEEFVTAAAAHGIDVGLYLSPWDRHDRRYSHDLPYNEYYLAQLQELLKRYGNVREIWFDGAKGQNAPNMSYYFSDWFAMVKELQSSINIFSDAGPDVRWVGNEKGFAGTPCWSTINRSSLAIGADGISQYLNKGDPRGTNWVPPECDVSIRKGWFWHKSESPKTLEELLQMYYNSVGRNCVLLINVPPNSTGLIPQQDANTLIQFKTAIDKIFTTNLAQNCSLKASSQRGGKEGNFGPQNVLDNDHLWSYWAPKEVDDDHWIEIRSQQNQRLRFNVVRIQEAIGLGQRIKQHEIYLDGKRIVKESSIGYKRLHRIKTGVVSGYVLKVRFTEFRAVPLISSLGLHLDPFWNPTGL